MISSVCGKRSVDLLQEPLPSHVVLSGSWLYLTHAGRKSNELDISASLSSKAEWSRSTPHGYFELYQSSATFSPTAHKQHGFADLFSTTVFLIMFLQHGYSHYPAIASSTKLTIKVRLKLVPTIFFFVRSMAQSLQRQHFVSQLLLLLMCGCG